MVPGSLAPPGCGNQLVFDVGTMSYETPETYMNDLKMHLAVVDEAAAETEKDPSRSVNPQPPGLDHLAILLRPLCLSQNTRVQFPILSS